MRQNEAQGSRGKGNTEHPQFEFESLMRLNKCVPDADKSEGLRITDGIGNSWGEIPVRLSDLRGAVGFKGRR